MIQDFDFVKNPRIKALGVFLIIVGFVGESILRKASHVFADELLSNFGTDFSHIESIIDKMFSIGAPIIIIYFPAVIILGIIIRNGLQKLDWILVPLLVGILTKGGVYGILSLRHKSSEFWELFQSGVPKSLLWFFIFFFIFFALWDLSFGLKKH